MAEQSRGRQRSLVIAAAAAAAGASLIGLAGASQAAAAPKCTVHFTSSDVNPVVGQSITLSWATSGADELVASWTTAHVPFVGTQVTTKNSPGPSSYQVTGLKSGEYCGGAVVNVVFAAAGAASSSVPAPTPTPTTSTSTAEPSTSASSDGATTSASLAAPTSSATPSATYPAQSPTGGSSTPWYEQPVNLLVLGLLCLVGSVALFNRERVRAVLVRRH